MPLRKRPTVVQTVQIWRGSLGVLSEVETKTSALMELSPRAAPASAGVLTGWPVSGVWATFHPMCHPAF